jgi:hypothetical protein
MNFVSLAPSSRKNKKYEIVFMKENSKPLTIHFGSKNSQTYIDHGDKNKRAAYIARHAPNENWNEVNAGSLSRYLLWGDSKNLGKNLNEYFKRFNIKN